MDRKNKRRLKKLLQFGVPVVLLWLLFEYGKLDVGRIRATLTNHWAALLIPSGILFVSVYITSVRWAMLVMAQGVRIRLSDAFRLTYVGYFFSLFGPGGVGGDIVKIVYLVRYFPHMRSAMATTVVVDRVLGLYGLFVLAIGAVALNAGAVLADGRLMVLAATIAGIFVSSSLLVGALFSRRLRRYIPFWGWLLTTRAGASLGRISDAFLLYRDRPATVFKSVLISVFNHAVLVAGFYSIGVIHGMDGSFPSFAEIVRGAEVSGHIMPPLDVFLAAPLAMFLNTIPISPSGLGVGEAAFGQLWQLFGYATGTEICLIYRCLYLVTALGGVYYYLTLKSELHITRLDTIDLDGLETGAAGDSDGS